MTNTDCDVLILGGGLAGLTLGIQLRRSMPHLRVTIVEKATFPVPEATHKVGESTIEIGGLYFADTVGMREVLDATHLPKLGLRFFFSSPDNRDISKRSEVGLRKFLPVKTWQIDRGKFENQLAERFRELGGDLIDGAKVGSVAIDPSGPHTTTFTTNDTPQTRASTWVVDASGRRAILKKQLHLAKSVPHAASAVWWRVQGDIDISTWPGSPAWQQWAQPSRRYSTNHLIGEGYWVWFIPLSTGYTSVGLVVDDETKPFAEIRTPELADAWLQTHEPQVFEQLKAFGERKDFLALKHYAHSVAQVYSTERWALAGEAGAFPDPFYSPGSDFVGMNNTFIADCIRASTAHAPDADARIEAWNKRYLLLFRAVLSTYTGLYPVFGRPEPMRAKLLWDFAFYWATHGFLFAQGHLLDKALYDTSTPLLLRAFELQISLQDLFRRWGALAPRFDEQPVMLDYGSVPWIYRLNVELQQEDPRPMRERLAEHVALLEQLAADLEAYALSRHPEVGGAGISDLPTATGELLKGVALR